MSHSPLVTELVDVIAFERSSGFTHSNDATKTNNQTCPSHNRNEQTEITLESWSMQLLKTVDLDQAQMLCFI